MDKPSTYAEIDLSAIQQNLSTIKNMVSSHVRIMAVVKANAYGHGIIEIARVMEANHVSYLGVARLEEAVTLRKADIRLPILVFGYTPPYGLEALCDYGITQTIYAIEDAQLLSSCATSKGKRAKIHIKIDTGMGRLGLLTDAHGRLPSAIETIARLPQIELEGIFTHFASADDLDKASARHQLDIFLNLLNVIQQKKIDIPLKHAANSAAIMDLPETHLDMVRPGICLYGLYPSPYISKETIALTPAMTLKSHIIHLKKVPPGFKVSYGSTYETRTHTTIATVPVGYADGYNRLLSSKGTMLVSGHRVPVVGRVCMDLLMLDVGKVATDIKINDEVVVFGNQGSENVSIDEIAVLLNTINYEIVTSVTSRIKRIYIP
jgi:alanine racemase